MIPSPTTLLTRLRLCRRDLLTVGINVDRHGPAELRRLILLHLDYFQHMLGHDVTPHAILQLVRRSAACRPTSRCGGMPRDDTHMGSAAPRRAARRR
jgi:hypothetical protein